MRDLGTASSFEERLLTFEVGADVYGLPIACVVEVSEVEPLACIPTLPASVGGVINHHGDALPVLHRTVLLGVAASTLRAPTHVVVMTARPSGGLRFGMPVDRIAGLVDGAAAVARGADPVAERRSLGGKLVCVLDPQRLAERARDVIERSVGRGE
jgi:purine-binding chemotaxis protein CheW